MPYLGTSQPSFPSFERSRNYFRTGMGGPPQARQADPPQLERWGGSSQRIARANTGAGGGGGVTSPSPVSPAEPVTQAPQTQAPPTPPQGAPQIQSPAPFTGEGYEAPTLGYGTDVQGSLQERLFQPVQQAAGQGAADVQQFADLFRTQAGPSRSYEGIGGEGTLSTAVEGGAMDPARALVGAQYQGPAGLDPNAVGNLQFLSGQLGQRQANLGTGAGLASSIGQTVQTLTPGEARFDAQDLFSPAYRKALEAQVGTPVTAFQEQLGAETTGAQEFAQQRGAEETDIAAKAAEYLTGRRSGISGDIEQQIADAQKQQIGASQAFSDVLGAGDASATIEALRKAQGEGYTSGFDPGGFETEAFKTSQGAEAAKQAIMDKYPTLKGIPEGELGVDNKGRSTYTVKGEDFRKAMTTEQAVEFKKRQGELEEAFSSQRGVPFPGGRTSGDYFGTPTGQQVTDPLYFGEQFQGPQVQGYLNFDPGFKPSRGNVSTEEQRSQFNNINDLLGDLDRIAEDENVYKAATIGANIKQYLEDEATALEAQVETLDQQGKEWFNQVKKLRKDYRKAEKKAEWGKIGAVVGGVAGGILGIGGGPLGVAGGASIGSGVGRSAGESLAD